MKTSEFLVAVLTLVGAVVSAGQDYITSGQAAGLSVAGALAYIVSRGLAKTEPRAPSGGPPTQ
jgi:hypothetical protein